MSDIEPCSEFMETDDYVLENHVIGKLPFMKPPEEPEIIFHNDQLWQESMSQDADDESVSHESVNDDDDEVEPVDFGYGVNAIAEWQRMMFQDNQSMCQDEGIKEIVLDSKVIFEVERVDCTSNGTCCECELLRQAEKDSESEKDTATKQQAVHEAPATGDEEQKGNCNLF